MMRGFLLACCALIVTGSAHTSAYLQFAVDVNGRTTPLRWTSTPVRWHATDAGVVNVSPGEFQAAVARAFDTWQDVPTASIAFTFAGFTSALPFDEDGVSVIGFQNEPDLERVLGATSFVIDDVTGEIIESDVFFNSVFQWSTAGSGEGGRFDLQSVATHEVGHFLGLAHSALGETELRPSGGRRVLASGSVMFPISGEGHDLSLASGSIHSAHGDFLNAWDADGLGREIDQCIRRDVVCDLASNREEEPLFTG